MAALAARVDGVERGLLPLRERGVRWEPSVSEGARALAYSLRFARCVISLLVCYKPLDNVIFARRATQRRGRDSCQEYAEVTPVRMLLLWLAKN